MTQSVFINNSVIVSSTIASADVAGDTVSCAFDFTNRVFWFTTQAMRAVYGAGSWNNSTTANPSTGVGGISMAGLTVGSYFPAFSDLETGSACTINTGASAFTISIPTGFSPFGGTGADIITISGSPTGLTGSNATFNRITLSWTAPTTGSSPTFYQIQYSKVGNTVWYNGPLVASTQTTATVTQLLASTNYQFQIVPINSAGNGVPSSTTTMATAAAPTLPQIPYLGLNIEGSNLSSISTLSSSFPHANSVIIPVFCSTANQTSTDVALTVTATTITGWVQAANTAGYNVFLAVYLNPRDGSPRQTITPGPSYAGVMTFMANLQSVCTQVAQIGAANGAVGMFCGVELQPWAGSVAGDAGPFSAFNVAQWQLIYLACKTTWPAGVVSYAALQTSLGFAIPDSAWSVDWTIWDAIGIDIYPGSNNTYELTSQFQTFFQTEMDPEPNTVSSVGQVPLFTALINYANSVGRQIIIVQCGIIPADGNQIAPGQANVLPPPYNFSMQSAWWQAILNMITTNYGTFAGFFAWDGGVNGYSSPYSGIDYWGVQSTLAAPFIDAAYSGLSGVVPSIIAPTGLTATVTVSSINVSWTAIPGTGISYIVQYSVHGLNTFIKLPATTAITNTILGLTANTSYDVEVYGIQGNVIGPVSTILTATTT